MELPKNVIDSVKRANELQQTIVNPEPIEDTPAPEPEAQESEEQALEQPETPDQSAQPSKDAIYWENRFTVLQGKYNKEVPALTSQVKELTRELESLKSSSQTADAPDRAKDALADMTEDELAEWGPELVSLVERIAGKKLAGFNSNNAEIDALKESVESLTKEKADHAKASFFSTLSARVPSWKAVNDDPKFHAFLSKQLMDERGYSTGKTRQDLLNDAEQQLNGEAVAAIFNEFLKSASAPAPQVPPNQQHPERTRSTVTPESNAKSFSRAEIAQFYKDVNRGDYASNPELKAQIEMDIFEAQRQGRVY